MMKVDIYWDLRSTIPERHTGVGKHVIEVVNGLNSASDVDIRILLAKDQVDLWEAQARVYGWNTIPTVCLGFTNKVGRLLAGAGVSPGLDRLAEGRDLIYSPMELLLSPKRTPFVNTIHGIPCFESSLPARSSRSLAYRYERLKQRMFFKMSRRCCARSFVVSDYLKDRLVAQFDWNVASLHTVYNGVDEAFSQNFEEAKQSTASGERLRLLQVGGANVFDGAPDLLKVARHLKTHYPEAKIWIAGDRHEAPWDSQLRSLSNVVWLGFLSSERLLKEMQTATALLYVPCVESFGIIGVEAMAVGLPILARRSTALPEVLGDAVCWFDPNDSESIEQGIRKTCRYQNTREAFMLRGRDRARQFTWPHTVERVVEGLREAAMIPNTSTLQAAS